MKYGSGAPQEKTTPSANSASGVISCTDEQAGAV